MSKKEEGKLTPIESVQLKLHLRICDFCSRFQKQAKFFTSHAMHTHEHLPATLSEEKKEVIRSLMKD
ncbi:MAG: hypothetical protein IPP72_14675 [Chitinophagaceae bacterium]|nr:hypothetical protein [Chitinophagaceae bacterium]